MLNEKNSEEIYILIKCIYLFYNLASFLPSSPPRPPTLTLLCPQIQSSEETYILYCKF